MVLRANHIVNPLWTYDITYMKMIDGVYICDNYMLIELWMLLVIVYMLCGGKLLLIAYILSVGDVEVICMCEHMHL
jgi:hypothetical protein